jgi:hypothetical protein
MQALNQYQRNKSTTGKNFPIVKKNYDLLARKDTTPPYDYTNKS